MLLPHLLAINYYSMKTFKIFIICILIILGFQASSFLALAQSYDFNANSGLSSAAQNAGYETSPEKNVEFYMSQIITIILSVLGVVFLILIIYGGLIWMTAAGNEEKAKKAKELITEAMIGLIIVLAAYAISYFIIGRLIGASLNNNPSL